MIKEDNLDLMAGITSMSNHINESDNYQFEADHLIYPYEIKTSTLPKISADLLPLRFYSQSHTYHSNTPIQDFGSCVPCRVLIGTAVFELYREFQYQNPNIYQDFDELHFIWYDTQDSENSREVGTIDDPLAANDSSFKSRISYRQYKAASQTTWHYEKTSFSIPSVDPIRTPDFTFCPIFVALDVDNSISVYIGGINHAAELVGGVSLNENAYWICKIPRELVGEKVGGSEFMLI